MIGVVVPAHNEEALLNNCLSSIYAAAKHVNLFLPVQVIVVLDSCVDQSLEIVKIAAQQYNDPCFRLEWIETRDRNVGLARAAGVAHLLQSKIDWLAFTDADSVVAADWLVMQRALNVEVVCGTIEVRDWSDHGEFAFMLASHFSATYTDAEHHRHIHGANLGMDPQIYLKAGGFPPMTAHEDVALVAALEKLGATIAWSALPRVVTSARRGSKTHFGFGNTLCAVVEEYKLRGTTEGFLPPAEVVYT